MKKRLLIFAGIIIVIGIIVMFKEKDIYIEIDGIKYAILVDGQSTNSFPSGNYKASVNCTNAEGYWDAVEQKVIINDITGKVSCCVSFTNVTNIDYLNNYIISLENDENQGNGLLTHEIVEEFTTIDNQTTTEAGYRYSGRNPNNYVWFNNELWRIIGVFGPESHGQIGKKLVKIIRNEPLGGIIFDKTPTPYGDWDTSSLKKMLNGAYYNHTVDIENCYVSETISTTCDYTGKGIKDEYKNIIANVTWYIGGYGGGSSLYQDERNLKTSVGKIGLMYNSDLYYANEKGCSGWRCYIDNWLFNNYYEWLLNGGKTAGYVGGSTIDTTVNSNDVRPVLYLSENTYKVSGTGTLLDPYIIGISNS